MIGGAAALQPKPLPPVSSGGRVRRLIDQVGRRVLLGLVGEVEPGLGHLEQREPASQIRHVPGQVEAMGRVAAVGVCLVSPPYRHVQTQRLGVCALPDIPVPSAYNAGGGPPFRKESARRVGRTGMAPGWSPVGREDATPAFPQPSRVV